MNMAVPASPAAVTLEVRALSTHYFTAAGVVRAVEDTSFAVGAGQILGLVGESGSGKSAAGLSVMRLIDRPGRIVAGQVLYRGRDLVSLPESEMRNLRGNRIAMVFQNPMTTLNPVLRIGTQMVEAVLAHDPVGRAEARSRAIEALGMVGIPRPEERLDAYPHQFSGGMRQRVAIAIAFLHRPDLIIADEPTTALDVTIQAQILAEMQRLTRQRGTALIWITHDLSVVAGLADEVAVMYSGRIVEYGSVDDLLDRPCHPYTIGLIESVPSRSGRGARLRQIPGSSRMPTGFDAGCAFRERCFAADAACASAPPVTAAAEGRWLRCFHPQAEKVP